MNLDGDTSIICLNILPVLIASLEQKYAILFYWLYIMLMKVLICC